MRKSTLSVLLVLVAVLALVSVASAALPSQVTGKASQPSATAYMDLKILSVTGSTSEIQVGDKFAGWCADSTELITLGKVYTFNVYSSLDEPTITHILPANWSKINYILNHKDGADAGTVQAAIWYYDGGGHTWSGHAADAAKLAALKSAADANAGYVPVYGENYAVILWDGQGVQPVIIELPIPKPPVVPEFPTLALPVAMLLGLVFTVYVVRNREN